MEKEWRTWPLRDGEGGKRKGEERKGGGNEEKRKRGVEESWNRAAEWLRPALFHSFFPKNNWIVEFSLAFVTA